MPPSPPLLIRPAAGLDSPWSAQVAAYGKSPQCQTRYRSQPNAVPLGCIRRATRPIVGSLAVSRLHIAPGNPVYSALGLQSLSYLSLGKCSRSQAFAALLVHGDNLSTGSEFRPYRLDGPTALARLSNSLAPSDATKRRGALKSAISLGCLRRVITNTTTITPDLIKAAILDSPFPQLHHTLPLPAWTFLDIDCVSQPPRLLRPRVVAHCRRIPNVRHSTERRR
ncbi:hypothetical protein FALBO_16980 [Fusarium albosuccineum]|uniref:Uncharacterized protein n=1 Tax=Fusarium albosuccineum TaxID=1237068 RepID=A0A8H4KD74_9HYPO|nr:hypothetical protein FALBO_16980 [Fusarium albosuccineum]